MSGQHVFITGGAGFIGCNAADHFLRRGDAVTIYDNLTRRGGRANLDWLHATHGGERLCVLEADIRDAGRLAAAVAERSPDVVLHLAGQVAVTQSVTDPREDFESNALGTFNVLEAVRHGAPGAALLYASTNKVYGGMEHVGIVPAGERYAYADYPHGIPESFPLDFHSPYGCSKGAGDQYMRDYARIYGLRTLVLRQSCIYGRRQFGVEDQGWVAHFVIATVLDRPIAIYGDGRQVRDWLYVEDHCAAIGDVLARGRPGEVYNIGGGNERTNIDVVRALCALLDAERPRQDGKSYSEQIAFVADRPGHDRRYAIDAGKMASELGWRPRETFETGLKKTVRWYLDNAAWVGEVTSGDYRAWFDRCYAR